MAAEGAELREGEVREYEYGKDLVYMNDEGELIAQVPLYCRYDRATDVDTDSSILTEFDYSGVISIDNVIRMFKLYALPEDCREMVANRLLEEINRQHQHILNVTSINISDEPATNPREQ